MPFNTVSSSPGSHEAQSSSSSMGAVFQNEHFEVFTKKYQPLLEMQIKVEQKAWEPKLNLRKNGEHYTALMNAFEKLDVTTEEELQYLLKVFIHECINNFNIQAYIIHDDQVAFIEYLAEFIINSSYVTACSGEEKYRKLASLIYAETIIYEQRQVEKFEENIADVSSINFIIMSLVVRMIVKIYGNIQVPDDNDHRYLAGIQFKMLYYAFLEDAELLGSRPCDKNTLLNVIEKYKAIETPYYEDRFNLVRCYCLLFAMDGESMAQEHFSEKLTILDGAETLSPEQRAEILIWMIRLLREMRPLNYEYNDLKKMVIDSAIKIHGSLETVADEITISQEASWLMETNDTFHNFFVTIVNYCLETKEYDEVFNFLIKLKKPDILGYYFHNEFLDIARDSRIPSGWRIKLYREAIKEIQSRPETDFTSPQKKPFIIELRLDLGNVLKLSGKMDEALNQFYEVFSTLNSYDSLSIEENQVLCYSLRYTFASFQFLLNKNRNNLELYMNDILSFFSNSFNLHHAPELAFYQNFQSFLHTLASCFFINSPNAYFLNKIKFWFSSIYPKETFINDVESLTLSSFDPCNQLTYYIALRVIELIKRDFLPTESQSHLRNFSEDEHKFLDEHIDRIKKIIENNSSLAARASFVSMYHMQQQLNRLEQDNFRLKEKVNQLENQLAASSSGTDNSEKIEDSRKRKREESHEQVKITRFFNPPGKKSHEEEKNASSSSSCSMK